MCLQITMALTDQVQVLYRQILEWESLSVFSSNYSDFLHIPELTPPFNISQYIFSNYLDWDVKHHLILYLMLAESIIKTVNHAHFIITLSYYHIVTLCLTICNIYFTLTIWTLFIHWSSCLFIGQVIKFSFYSQNVVWRQTSRHETHLLLTFVPLFFIYKHQLPTR